MITWRPAQLADVPDMVMLTRRWYLTELEGVLNIDLDRLCESLGHAILRRNFNLGTEVIQLAHEDDRLVAWTWAGRGSGTDYIADETAEAHMLHIDLSISARKRIRIIDTTLAAWEEWCRILEIPVLVSTTVREDWQPFMELHRRRGYVVRGSHAFKKITKE
jgi:hypothetical protein